MIVNSITRRPLKGLSVSIGSHLNETLTIALRNEKRYAVRRQTRLFSSVEPPKQVLVLGSNGALGAAVCQHLQQQNHRVMGADVTPDAANNLDAFIELSPSLADQTVQLSSSVETFGGQLDAIVCANGGFMEDPKMSSALDYANTCTTMLEQNLLPVLAANYIAHRYMNPSSSLMVVTGATAALQATPGMLGYGVAKAASHHVVQTLGACTGQNDLYSKSIRRRANTLRRDLPSLDGLSVVGILPTTLDTPANRASMTPEDTWTQPDDIAQQIGIWVDSPALRPHSGSLIKVYTKPGQGAIFQVIQ